MSDSDRPLPNSALLPPPQGARPTPEEAERLSNQFRASWAPPPAPTEPQPEPPFDARRSIKLERAVPGL